MKPFKHPADIKVIIDAGHHLAFATSYEVGHPLVYFDDMLEGIKELLDQVNSLEEFRNRLIEVYPAMTSIQLADAIADGLAVANLAGRDEILRGL